MPYFVFSFAGMLAWTLYSTVVTRTTTVLVANASIISKVFFPRLLLPLSQVLSSLVDVAVSLALMAVLLVVYGVWAGPQIVLVPVWLALFVVFALGIGFAAGALSVRYRDVQYVVPFVIQFLLFATPIAYLVSSAPASKRWLFTINPLTGLFEGVRWSLIGTPPPSVGAITYSLAAAVVFLVFGLVVFSKLENEFADVI
ncbi:MAG: ABC transporter permease [Actinobacteria bacterium]|nr:ABC transporter permease [Actinomycetota bacterium]